MIKNAQKSKTNVIRKDVRDEGNKGFLFARKTNKKTKNKSGASTSIDDKKREIYSISRKIKN